eukprot:TRINITY_DN54930_c0_g1_i1.p1 TRINITY_DN54930_c0_g1~~TRINITY_DN54930_c0_g1_i1.p1  ORF type:complete len:250 (-),score=63.23 TRINITY_DN54930_c0_g1_i1:78-827(-)
MVLPLPVFAVLTSFYCFSQGQEDDQKESGISCYTCGLETVDPHLDKPGSYSTRVYTHKTELEFKMYNHSCDEMDRKEGQDIPVTLTSIDMPGVKLNTAVKAASGGKYDLVKGFEIYEEEYVLLREKVPELDEWDKVPVILAKVKENYNMAMWIKECDKGITSCFVAQGDYDNQLPTFRGCAGTVYPHDEKCAFEKQAVSIVEGKKSVDVGVSLCYCNKDLCNIDLSGALQVWPGLWVILSLALLGQIVA